MKRFSLKPRLEALGKYVRDHPIFPFLPENALFWMFLLLLSIGSAMTLYGKVNGGGESRPANAPPEPRRITMNTHRPPALFYVFMRVFLLDRRYIHRRPRPVTGNAGRRSSASES